MGSRLLGILHFERETRINAKLLFLFFNLKDWDRILWEKRF